MLRRIPYDIPKRSAPEKVAPPPRICKLCGDPLPPPKQGGVRKYCDKCRNKQHAMRCYQYRERKKKWRGCTPEGCNFYLVCCMNIQRLEWNPYCFPAARLHELFVKEYGREAAA